MSDSRHSGALLLIDFQNDFLSRPGFEPHRDILNANAAAWLDLFRAGHHPVAFIHTLLDPDKEERMPHWKAHGTRLCVRGTQGAASPATLQPQDDEKVFEKQGFLLNSPAVLAQWVKQHGGNRVVIAGLMTHACVYHHIAALLSEGVEVDLAEGSLGSDNPAFAAQTLVYLASKGVNFRALKTRLPAKTQNKRPAQPAHSSLETWPKMKSLLMAWADLIERSTDSLASVVTQEIHKPIDLAHEEIQTAVRQIRDTCARRELFQPACTTAQGTTLRVPHGKVLSITPWNNPVSISVGRIAPALAYGNSVYWKPSPSARETATKLMDLAASAGLDGSHLECIEGDAETAEALLKDPAVDAVTFSGSLTNGRRVLAIASQRLLPCQLELGGNNASLIACDVDLAVAAKLIAAAAFDFAGQRCTANRRVILLPVAYDTFRELLFAEIQSLTLADPATPGTRFGPMQSTHSCARIEGLLSLSARTAKVTRFHHNTCKSMGDGWCAPAVVEDAPQDSAIITEESFGPVLVLQKAKSWEDGLSLLNAVRHGLVASLFSPSQKEWNSFRKEAKAGTLKWNSATAGAPPDLPFGGWKLSGHGAAEHGTADEEFFTRHQTHMETNPSSTPSTL